MSVSRLRLSPSAMASSAPTQNASFAPLPQYNASTQKEAQNYYEPPSSRRPETYLGRHDQDLSLRLDAKEVADALAPSLFGHFSAPQSHALTDRFTDRLGYRTTDTRGVLLSVAIVFALVLLFVCALSAVSTARSSVRMAHALETALLAFLDSNSHGSRRFSRVR